MSGFNWPCERREAHGPHPRTEAGLMAPKGSETNAVAYVSGNGIKTTDPMCPGVQAHPNTMIGRDQPGSRPVVPEESWDAAPRPQREDAGGE